MDCVDGRDYGLEHLAKEGSVYVNTIANYSLFSTTNFHVYTWVYVHVCTSPYLLTSIVVAIVGSLCLTSAMSDTVSDCSNEG
jgi:hypothetical protein